MKTAIIAVLLISAAFATSSNMEQLFDSWMAKYGVSYSSPAEEAQRFHVFCENYKFITQYNEVHTSSKLALNKFSDLTSQEFRALYTGLNNNQFSQTSAFSGLYLVEKTNTATTTTQPTTPQTTQQATQQTTQQTTQPATQPTAQTTQKTATQTTIPSTNKTPTQSSQPVLGATQGEEEEAIPANTAAPQSMPTAGTQTENFQQHPFASSWNWETQGVLNPVQDQGQCGCCWSFSTTAAMEALYKINGNALTKFSEQQLVDCDTQDQGCNGGVPLYAMQYVAKAGMMLETAYPYTGKQGQCQYNQAEATQVATGGTDVPPKNVDALKSAIYQQPTVVGVDASNVLQSYSSGVLDNTSGCTANVDHAVLAVGYGNFEGKDAFVVRNSWGTDFGVHGYFYVSTNSDNNGEGTCGILTNPVAPVGRKSVHSA